MSAVAETDAGIHSAKAEDVLYLERSAIRDNIPLPILVRTCEIVLKGFESDFAVFIQSIPEIDPETLDPDNRYCPVCWDEFNLQSKHHQSSHPEGDPTPLRLPCAHHICSACIHDWLPKAGTCPACRQQFGPQNGDYSTVEHEKFFRLREPYEVIAEITPIYLASNPKNVTFGEFALWLYADDGDDPDALKARAQWAMRRFQGYTIGLVEAMRQDPEGRQWLKEIRAGIAGRPLMKDSDHEAEVGSDEGDIMEDNLETLDNADAVSEGYRSSGEEDGPMDDDEEESMDENEDADTVAATVGEEEDLTDEKDDDDTDAATESREEDLTGENEDADTAAAAAGEEEGEQEDLMDENEDAYITAAAVGEEEDTTDEGEDFDVMSEDDDDWEYELEVDEQHTPLTVLGCAAVVSIVGMGILIAL